MEFTPAGLAALIIVGLLLRGGGGRVAIIVSAICGTAIGIFATAAALFWDLGGTIAGLFNNVGGGLG